MGKRLIVTIVGILILGAWSSGLTAAEKKARAAAGNPHELMEAVAKRLGLSDQQKGEMKTIHEKYQPQYQKLHHEELEEMSKVLTPEQRDKAKEMIKEWQERRSGAKTTGEKEKSPENK